jgi:hypothetical protein
MKRTHPFAMAAALGLFVSCGGGGSGTPVAPAPLPTPTPAPAATPTPAPNPSPTPPCPTDPCEVPVERETKPVRITLRLFVVEDPAGGVFQYKSDDDGTPIIPVNYAFRLDIIAKDNKNKETKGSGNVIWHWDDNMIQVESLDNVYHPRLRAIRNGSWCAAAELDGVTSNELCLDFRY